MSLSSAPQRPSYDADIRKKMDGNIYRDIAIVFIKSTNFLQGNGAKNGTSLKM